MTLLRLCVFIPLVSWAQVAQADAVMPADFDCPNGSKATPSHSGGYCRPTNLQEATCSSDSDCADGLQCLDVSRCIEKRTLTYRMGEYTETRMVTPSEDGSCPAGECSTMKVCASASAVGTDACVPAGAPLSSADATAGQASEGATATSTGAPVSEKTGGGAGDDDSSSCAMGVGGLSASMAGLLGLVALGRRES